MRINWITMIQQLTLLGYNINVDENMVLDNLQKNKNANTLFT